MALEIQIQSVPELMREFFVQFAPNEKGCLDYEIDRRNDRDPFRNAFDFIGKNFLFNRHFEDYYTSQGAGDIVISITEFTGRSNTPVKTIYTYTASKFDDYLMLVEVDSISHEFLDQE